MNDKLQLSWASKTEFCWPKSRILSSQSFTTSRLSQRWYFFEMEFSLRLKVIIRLKGQSQLSNHEIDVVSAHYLLRSNMQKKQRSPKYRFELLPVGSWEFQNANFLIFLQEIWRVVALSSIGFSILKHGDSPRASRTSTTKCWQRTWNARLTSSFSSVSSPQTFIIRKKGLAPDAL